MFDLDKFSNHIMLTDDDDNSLSYGECADFCRRIGDIVNRGTVLCLCGNSIASVAGYIAFLNKHIVPILQNQGIDETRIKNILEVYSPQYIWCPDNSINKHHILKGMDVKYHFRDYSLLVTGLGRNYYLHDDLALLLTTSGSTGSNKYVRQSYGNIKSNTESMINFLGIEGDEKPITTLPMNYTYGLSIINSHVMRGATILVTEKSIMQQEFWDFFKKHNATSLAGVPCTYEILDKLKLTEMELPSLKTMSQGGGKLSHTLQLKFAKYAKETNRKFVVGYGQCEGTTIMTYLPEKWTISKCGSVGIAIPGGKVTLIDDEGHSINKINETGEILYEGDNVALGYASQGEDLSLGNEWNGKLHTGDLAKKDEDGCLYIVGRKKRFLKIYGNRIGLDEMDEELKNRFADSECVSSGYDDNLYVFTTNKEILDDIKKFIANMTKFNSSALHVVCVDSIPRNDAGKIKYKELELFYRQ